MFGEPPQTQYDLKFELLGVPVRVHPFFWLLTVFLGRPFDPKTSSSDVIIWVGVVFFSILVHEYGHAWVIRYFGWNPRIVLHSFGGLAIYNPNNSQWQGGSRARNANSTTTQILISLAGPGAGFLIPVVVILLLFATGSSMGYFPLFGLEIPLGNGDFITNDKLQTLIEKLLMVNIYWGILNLMPIYPLDGGKVSRELFLANTTDGVRKSLQLSIATGVVLAVVALTKFQSFYMALMFGYLAYLNYQQLNGPYGGGFGGFGNRRW